MAALALLALALTSGFHTALARPADSQPQSGTTSSESAAPITEGNVRDWPVDTWNDTRPLYPTKGTWMTSQPNHFKDFPPFAPLDNGPLACLVLNDGEKRCYGNQSIIPRASKHAFDYVYTTALDIPHGGSVKISVGGRVSEYTTSQRREPGRPWEGFFLELAELVRLPFDNTDAWREKNYLQFFIPTQPPLVCASHFADGDFGGYLPEVACFGPGAGALPPWATPKTIVAYGGAQAMFYDSQIYPYRCFTVKNKGDEIDGLMMGNVTELAVFATRQDPTFLRQFTEKQIPDLDVVENPTAAAPAPAPAATAAP